MMWIIALFFVGLTRSTVNVTAPTYIIDTSQPVDVYLKQICEDFAPHANVAFDTMMDMIPSQLRPEFRLMAVRYWQDIKDTLEPYSSELKYMSQCLGRSIDDMITVNLVYDFTAFCTSIVAVDSNGRILHGRNQDFPVILRNDTVNMKYIDADGNELFEATTFFGYVGIPTGRKLNGFSITIDARFGIDYWHNLESIHAHNWPSGWLVRECFLRDTDFTECVQRLEETTIMAPIYYIVAGDDESKNGAVITRNVTHAIDTWYLRDSVHQWFVVETNYDHWTNASQHFDARRSEAIRMLNEIGQENISDDTLFEILSTPPILASNTVYTSLLSPSDTDDNAYNVTVRFDTTEYPEVKNRVNLPAKWTEEGN